jgi:glutamyl-tRNA synthetase
MPTPFTKVGAPEASAPGGKYLVGRLAPSPTGAFHVGNARTFLIAWLAARQAGGRVLLRIEDIDSPRVKAGAAKAAIDDLLWLGLDWDDDPVVQTDRLDIYESALTKLRQAELVYPCTCSRSDVERAASAPHAEHAGPVYPGTCCNRQAAHSAELSGRPFSWRFRLPAVTPKFNDQFCVLVDVDLHRDEGDFVVWKSAGTPAYQLAVVVDDALSGVTDVVRGDDLIPSTPRQILLYHALGWEPPRFAHVPLVVGPDGRRLAKRHGDTRLETLRAAGVSSRGLIGLLAWSCGWIETVQCITARELVPLFRWDTIPRETFVLTPDLIARAGELRD